MTKPYRSRIEPTMLVYPGTWVLSLVAKAKGKNPEHAFIIVEGLSEDWNTVIFRRYDFVSSERDAAMSVKKAAGCVVMKQQERGRATYNEEALDLFFWADMMSDINVDQGAHGASWGISAPEEVEALHRAIEADQQTPPDYHMLGKSSFVGASSSQSGHNCYTWARAKIKSLNQQNISHDERLQKSALDFVVSRTTRHLSPPRESEPTSGNCCVM